MSSETCCAMYVLTRAIESSSAHIDPKCAARTWLYSSIVSDRSRARSSVKRRRKGVKTDGREYSELNDFLPSIECGRLLKISLQIRRGFFDSPFRLN